MIFLNKPSILNVQTLTDTLLLSVSKQAVVSEIEGGDPARATTLTVSLPVSKASVASRLSLTPEYFSRVLRELETQGLIAIDKRDIRVLDVQRLADYGSH